MCPQQLLAPFLKLIFPRVPENYVSVSSCCSASSERTCCLGSSNFDLPSTFSVFLVIYFSSIKGVTEQASGFPGFPWWLRAWIVCFLLVLLLTCCESTPDMKCVCLDGVLRFLHCRWQFSNWYFASRKLIFVSDSEQALTHLSALFSHKGTKKRVDIFCILFLQSRSICAFNWTQEAL